MFMQPIAGISEKSVGYSSVESSSQYKKAGGDGTTFSDIFEQARIKFERSKPAINDSTTKLNDLINVYPQNHRPIPSDVSKRISSPDEISNRISLDIIDANGASQKPSLEAHANDASDNVERFVRQGASVQVFTSVNPFMVSASNPRDERLDPVTPFLEAITRRATRD